MLINKGFIRVGYDTFYPLSRIVEVRYWNLYPDVTEIVFDDGKIVRSENPILSIIDEIDKNK